MALLSRMKLAVLVSCLVACASICAAAERPTYAAAKSDFDAGQYRPCLQKIAQVLAMPDSKRNLAERYDLFVLRGECLLQLKYADLADDAFHTASSVLKGSDDLQKIADAEAMAILIKSSPGLKYQPKDKSIAPIDIVPAESRKKAMVALFDDRMAALRPRVEAALPSNTLAPIRDLVPAISDMYLLEMAATGETKQTLSLGKQLGERARDLINGAMKQITDRIQDLNMLANEPSSGTRGDIGYRGLTSPERDELRQLADELVKIEQVSANARQMARRMGGNVEAWEAILADCEEVKELAQRTYARRY